MSSIEWVSASRWVFLLVALSAPSALFASDDLPAEPKLRFTLSQPLQRNFGPTALMAPSEVEEPADGGWSKCPLKLWDGFGSGLRDGFEALPRPVDSPLYFEDPFINTELKLIWLYHEFAKGSLLGGGDLTVLALQARVALTERLQFFASSDGHSDLEDTVLPDGEGWNDIAAGFKYALYVEKDTHTVVSTGVRWKLSNGSREVFQGIEDEFSCFVSGARSFGKLNVIGGTTLRLTTHGQQGNDSVSWDFHANYEVCEWFHPLVEYHGFHYLSNGSRLNVRDGLLDYGNLGAGDVAGSTAQWAGIGARLMLKPGVSLSAIYSHGIQAQGHNDIFKRRVVTNLAIRF